MTDMTMTDATILASLLTELRLPSIARNWKRITEAANREGWSVQKTLATLLEIEVAERASRRIQRQINPKRRLEKPSPASTSPPRRS
jgi:DNA replication protein DnaC